MLTLKGAIVSAILVAAVAAAGSSKKEDYATLVYYNTGAGCDTITVYKQCNLGNVGCTTIIGSNLHVQLYNSIDIVGECSYPLAQD